MNKRGIAFLLAALVPAFLHAADLIPCPDCQQPVSQRAVMCPRCGCPGEAIKEVAAMRESERQAPPLHPLARLVMEQSQGYAVAFADGDRRFLIIDAMLLSDTTTLQITPLTTNSPVAYQKMQIACDAPLVRFQTEATNLLFLSRSQTGIPQSSNSIWLTPTGTAPALGQGQAPPRQAVAFADAQTNLIAFLCRQDGKPVVYPVPDETAWLGVAPSAFRVQMALLAKAKKEATQQQISGETARALEETKWLSAFLEKRARRIVELSKEDRKP